MFSAWNRRDWPPEERAAAELQGFAVDKNFFSSLKGILLETELALTFIIFICFTASISAYMAAALLEFFITLTFLFLYATQYYQRFDQLNWPCLDFLRCLSAIIIFLVVSFAAVTSREGAAIAAFVFGIILVSVFAYDAFKIYRTEMAPRATQGCPVGLAELDLHLIEVTLHLLLHPQGLIAAACFCVQRGLQRVHHPQVVALGLLHLLIFLCQLPLNVGLDLVELQLGTKDLTLLMFQGGLRGGWGQVSEVDSQGPGWSRGGRPIGCQVSLELWPEDEMGRWALLPRSCGRGSAELPGLPDSWGFLCEGRSVNLSFARPLALTWQGFVTHLMITEKEGFL
ncbi:CKLF-like MARVEL transmembrane domain-containing protein 5 [Sciurus carolinensis]|uniref:CKLF-like MARVEL transmembrane domain-containing protein 5 n=1 Tax=Sciurus carolinensis TaxID=30640 RepID=A0AA41SY66_SCICA|nr:CKLF-like MARVEL transmembrane domain-containing protein 5 [Sciurus carolinensis]